MLLWFRRQRALVRWAAWLERENTYLRAQNAALLALTPYRAAQRRNRPPVRVLGTAPDVATRLIREALGE